MIRHGEAEGNVFRRIHGHYDSLLTPRGYRQAKCLEKRFEGIRIDACYASDLVRASLTARSICVPQKLKLRRDSRFREVALGEWEDLPFGCLDKHFPEEMQRFNHDPIHWHVPGSETYEEYTGRFLKAMEEVAGAHEGGAIAIFAHGIVIRGALMRLLFNDDVSKLPFCDNTGVSKLIYDNGKFTGEFIYDNSHLPEELSTHYVQRWWRAAGNRRDVNFYYLPYEASMELTQGMKVPQQEPGGLTLAGILREQVVALVSMGAPEGKCGRILGMSLKAGMDGRYYGDQLLGCGFSHFRRLGCTQLHLAPGDYPDDIAARYEFDPTTRMRSIDNTAFDWECLE